MEELIEKLKQKREELRQVVKDYWKAGSSHEQWINGGKDKNAELNKIHEVITKWELSHGFKEERTSYEVCGWSDKHNYFRNKYYVSESYKQTKEVFEKLKKANHWRIPTIIVKCVHYRKTSPAMVDFDNTIIEQLGFSDNQTVIDKHMMGNRSYRWKELHLEDERVTY